MGRNWADKTSDVWNRELSPRTRVFSEGLWRWESMRNCSKDTQGNLDRVGTDFASFTIFLWIDSHGKVIERSSSDGNRKRKKGKKNI